MGFHNFFGEKIIFGGPVADPVKIRDGFLLDSLDFYWIFTGFSLEVQHVVGIILLAQIFSRGEKRFDKKL